MHLKKGLRPAAPFFARGFDMEKRPFYNASYFLWVNRLPFFLYCLLIIWLSSGPRSIPGPDFDAKDKLLHFLAFGGMGILAFRATRTLTPLPGRSLRFWLAVSFTILFGLTDEIHQYFVPGRSADALDVVADAAGALFWTASYARLRKSPFFRHPFL